LWKRVFGGAGGGGMRGKSENGFLLRERVTLKEPSDVIRFALQGMLEKFCLHLIIFQIMIRGK